MSGHFVEDDEYRGGLDLSLWRRILGHTNPYRGQLAGLGLSGLVCAGVDAMFPLVTAWMIDEAGSAGMSGRLAWFGGTYFALLGLLAFCVWLFIKLAGQVATGVAYDLRTKGFSQLQDLSFSYYDVRPVGWLVTRLTSDCSKVSGLIPWVALDLVWGSTLLVAIVGAMFWLNWQLALVVLTIVPPLVLLSVIFQYKLLASSRLVRKTNSQLTASYNEGIMGVRTTKALVREGQNLGEFQVHSGAMFRHSMRNAIQSAVYLPLVISLGSVGVGLALWNGGVDVMFGMTIGTLVAFMQYAALFYQPIQELAGRFTELQSAQAAAERVQGLLDTEAEIKDSPEVAVRVEAGGGREHDRIASVEFADVTFWYKPGEPILDRFNLRVEAGETIALVGATGGGKSTIVNLVARFYEPKEGVLRINGSDYMTLGLHWLQSRLGVVLQTPHLFDGTIADNIRYGNLEASDDQIEEAARIAGASGFIEESEKGYQATVGEGGSKLSTGQRQLVSLARAVLADPQIFIMDEATSSVDTETERLIQHGIERLLKGRMSFVIAHRLSTIRSADRILVIDGGRIVEQGSHDALIRNAGRYHQLYTNQFALDQEQEAIEGE